MLPRHKTTVIFSTGKTQSFYSLLEKIGVKYLLVDSEVHNCQETLARLACRFRIKDKNFKLAFNGDSSK
jgi:hypothetical protein